jgi:hypothetical protein
MQFSYICRIACVAFCSIGLLQVVFECVAWIVSLRLTSNRRGLSAGFTERLLFLLALSTRLGPTLLVLGLLLPAYMRGEEISSAEHVGVPCIIAAALVLVWFLYYGARLLLAMGSMQRCFDMCREIAKSKDGLPILLYPGERTLLAAGKPEQSVLLAEMLVTKARANKHPLPSLHLALLSRQEDLQARVERLLTPVSAMAEAANGAQ